MFLRSFIKLNGSFSRCSMILKNAACFFESGRYACLPNVRTYTVQNGDTTKYSWSYPNSSTAIVLHGSAAYFLPDKRKILFGIVTSYEFSGIF